MNPETMALLNAMGRMRMQGMGGMANAQTGGLQQPEMALMRPGAGMPMGGMASAPPAPQQNPNQLFVGGRPPTLGQ